ncbi:MAG: cache domain-containing protein, partial [Cyanobacteria bacterium P01_F01_bin.56]
HRPVDTADLHPVLAAVQWIDFRQGEGDFNANFKELLRTLETDRAHLEAHTRLLVKALEWENKQRSDDVLLRGRELLWAERWSQETVAYDKQPSMTAPQKEFIAASATFHDKNLQREARRRRLKGWMQIGTAIAVLMGMGISGTLSLRNGQKAVNDVAAQLHQELSGRIEDNIAQQIKLPNLINQINANAARRGELTTQSLASETYLWQQMQYLDAVSWMYYAAASNGSFVGIRRSLEDNLQAVINDPTSDFLGHYYDLDAQGQRTTLASVNQATYDARERPWFLTAVAANEPIWSNVYVNTGLGELIFSAVAPVYDAGGDLLGVAGVDYSFNDLSTFLEALEIGKTGEAFIMESSGLLVASSTGEALYQLTDDNNVERIEAINSENNLTQSTAQVIDQRLELPALSERAQLSAVIDGEEHFIQVSKFADQQGIDWVIVVMIPQSDFLGEINKNSRTTLLLMLLATGLTVVTIVTAHQLSEISERSVK